MHIRIKLLLMQEIERRNQEHIMVHEEQRKDNFPAEKAKGQGE